MLKLCGPSDHPWCAIDHCHANERESREIPSLDSVDASDRATMTIDAMKAVAAVEAADDAFRADHTVIFGTEAERLKMLFGARARRFKDWDRSGPCLYRGCKQPSIARSHTVQRAKVLERIAEQGHVLTPSIDQNGDLVMERIGIGLASTFPGFCLEHEQLFADFEATGVISTSRHLALQMWRTIAREIARRRFGIEHGEKALEDYRAARRAHFNTAIKAVDVEAEVHDLLVSGDALDDSVSETLADQKAILADLEGTLFSEVMTYLEKGGPEPACSGFLMPSDDPNHPPLELPVAVSGVVFADYQKGNKVHHIPCVVGVIPQEGATLLFIGTLREHQSFLRIWQKRIDNILGMLNLVEGWMVHGTDHWFIRPSVWASLPSSRKREILDGLISTDGVPGRSEAPSIFDDLRLMALNALAPQLGDLPAALQPAMAMHLAGERAKLDL